MADFPCQSVEPALSRAFSRGHEVALIINSPGGAPAQSQLIYNFIRRKAEKTGKKVTAFVEDVAASGGYWIAAAADRIYAAETSVVGSIGVRTDSFGFHELLSRIGIERRLITTGENKARLDPFKPLSEDDLAWLKAFQVEVYSAFRNCIQSRRHVKNPDAIFNGDIWLGSRACEIGLVDGLKSIHEYADDAGLAIKPVLTKGEASMLRRLLRRLTTGVLDGVEEWVAWKKVGL